MLKLAKTSYQEAIRDLEERKYYKLIVGAALKDFHAIEEYSYLFAHAYANVVDISAFPHSVICAKAGIEKAVSENPSIIPPIIMVSVNVGEDPHFRRVELDYDNCVHCMKCLPACPSGAFSSSNSSVKLGSRPNLSSEGFALELEYNIDLCFGCDQCLDHCAFDALSFKDWSPFEASSIGELISCGAGGIEIHLNEDLESFEKFFMSLPILPEDFLLSFSVGSEKMNDELLKKSVELIVRKVSETYGSERELIVQVDGIPMSGTKDIHNKDMASIEKSKLILEHLDLRDQVYVQLAGGMDETSLAKAHKLGVPVNGVAIGSYARKKIAGSTKIDSDQAIELARSVVRKTPEFQ